MVKKRMILALAASLCLTMTAGCGNVFDVAGDILSLSVADTSKDEDDSYGSGDEEIPKRQVTVKPTQLPTATPTPTPTEEAKEMVYCTSAVNVRDAASKSSQVIGMLNPGDAVERLGQEGGWVKILYEGQEAYVYQDYVSNAQP